jgi:L-fucose dehydrogenase
MELGLENKIVIVTGGARGIGAAVVQGCLEEGAIPIVIDRDTNTDACRALAEKSAASAAGVIQAQLSDPEECRESVETVAAKYGRIDAIINNAGKNDRVGLQEGNPADFVASLHQNLLHYYSMAHYSLPHLKTARGAIVNIGSKVAVVGQGGTSGYAAAKGAILALTREWAVELLPFGIRVNAVVPAEVMTPLYESWLATFPSPAEKLKKIVAKIPFGCRMTTPQEIAATVLFLISGKAAHTTGQHLFVDGGYVHLDRVVPQ